MGYQRWQCERCQDWGTVVPGDNARSRTVDPGSVGQGTEYCDCAKGRALAADAAQRRGDDAAGMAGQ
jgi:hypothetical protein